MRTRRPIPGKPIHLFVDANEIIWLFTNHDKVFRIDPAKNYSIVNSSLELEADIDNVWHDAENNFFAVSTTTNQLIIIAH